MDTAMKQYACEFNEHVYSLNSLLNLSFGDRCDNSSSSESLLTLLNGGIERQSQSEYLKSDNMNKSSDKSSVGSPKIPKKHKKHSENAEARLDSTIERLYFKTDHVNQPHDENVISDSKSKKKHKKVTETDGISYSHANVPQKHKHERHKFNSDEIVSKGMEDVHIDVVGKRKRKKHKSDKTCESGFSEEITDNQPEFSSKKHIVISENPTLETLGKKKKRHKEHSTSQDLNVNKSSERIYQVEDSLKPKGKHKTVEIANESTDAPPEKVQKKKKNRKKHPEENLENISEDVTENRKNLLQEFSPKKRKKQVDFGGNEVTLEPLLKKKAKHKEEATSESTSSAAVKQADVNRDETNVEVTRKEKKKHKEKAAPPDAAESFKHTYKKDSPDLKRKENPETLELHQKQNSADNLQEHKSKKEVKRKKHKHDKDDKKHMKRHRAISVERITPEGAKKKRKTLLACLEFDEGSYGSMISDAKDSDAEGSVRSTNLESNSLVQENTLSKIDESTQLKQQETKENGTSKKREVNSDTKEHKSTKYKTETNVMGIEGEQQKQLCTSKERKKTKKHKPDNSFTPTDEVKRKKQSESPFNKNRKHQTERTSISEGNQNETNEETLLQKRSWPSEQSNAVVNLSVPERPNDTTVSEKECKESRVRTEHETTQEGIKHSPWKIKSFRKKKKQPSSVAAETTDDEIKNTGSSTSKRVKKNKVRKGTVQDEPGNVSQARKGNVDSDENKQKTKDGGNEIKSDLDSDFDSVNLELDSNSLQADEVKMLQSLDILLPFDVPLSHTIETRMSSCPTKEQKLQFQNLDLKMKTGPYTKEEDQIIINNWNEFYSSHNLPNSPQLFLTLSFENKILLPGDKRTNFVQFLGRNLENRMLYSIYRRFKVIFNKTYKKGKFTKEEDNIILNYMKKSILPNPFAALTKIINRPRNYIKSHYEVLIQRDGKCSWTLGLIKELIDNVMEVTERSVIDDLKDFTIEKEHWQKIEHKMNIPATKLRMKWLNNIYPRLFAKDFQNLQDIQRQLINVLYDYNEEDVKAIDWNAVALNFDGMTAKRLYRIFRNLRDQHVPVPLQTKFRDTVDHLKNVYLNLSKKSNNTKIKQLVYHHGHLIEVPIVKSG